MPFPESVVDLQGNVGTSGLELFFSGSGAIKGLKIYLIFTENRRRSRVWEERAWGLPQTTAPPLLWVCLGRQWGCQGPSRGPAASPPVSRDGPQEDLRQQTPRPRT